MENLISLSPSRELSQSADPADRKNWRNCHHAELGETVTAVANAVIVGSGLAGYTAAITWDGPAIPPVSWQARHCRRWRSTLRK